MKDNFSSYHPLVNIVYFIFIIGVSMFLMHPIYLFISLISALIYSALLIGGRKTLRNCVLFVLPLMVIVALINPMFNHYGVTTLAYLPNGNAITLESMTYGLCMAVMLCEVICWFRCYNEVMTSDKFIYLFGRLIPALSLILSMCMRFIPRFRKRASIISNGQKCIGRDASSGSFLKRMKSGLTTLSILITWSLENAIQTGDSMKSRGYGLKGRTAFSIYRFDHRDGKLMITMTALAILFFIGCGLGYAQASFDPRIKIAGLPPSGFGIVMMLSYLVFALLPPILGVWDHFHWKQLRAGISSAGAKNYRLWETE